MILTRMLRIIFKSLALRRRCGLTAALLGVLLAGCAGKPKTQAEAGDAAPKIWPAPPETARIAFVQSVHEPRDVGVKASALTRFGRWITGSTKGNEALEKPFGIALDEQDNLCLTDTSANVVCYYERDKKKWHRWGKIGRVRFASPVAVAKHGATIFVADSALAAVVGFDESGKLLFQAMEHLSRPSGLAILGDRLFVADSQRHCVVVFDLQGRFQTEFGRRGLGPGEFNFPTHLSADEQGDLFVTDSMNGRVQVLDAQGHFKAQAGSLGDSPGHFGRPKGVAVDSLAHLYVIDALFDNIQIFDAKGKLLLSLGEPGRGPGEFWLPNGIAISRHNEIYVADSYNRRVQIFKYIGPS
jgi:sugar lactone lactonase YvrE